VTTLGRRAEGATCVEPRTGGFRADFSVSPRYLKPDADTDRRAGRRQLRRESDTSQASSACLGEIHRELSDVSTDCASRRGSCCIGELVDHMTNWSIDHGSC